jgi:hypothetical protein
MLCLAPYIEITAKASRELVISNVPPPTRTRQAKWNRDTKRMTVTYHDDLGLYLVHVLWHQ